MKFLRVLALLFSSMFGLSSVSVMAQNDDSENMRRAMVAFNQYDVDDVILYAQKELAEHPKNGLAHALNSFGQLERYEYEKAIESADCAIKYCKGKKDKKWLSLVYLWMAESLSNLSRPSKDVLSAYDNSLRFLPENQKTYEKRGFYYINKDDEASLALAEKDFEKIRSLNSANAIAYIGLGQIAVKRKDYETGKSMYDYALKLDSRSDLAIDGRAECLICMRKYAAAADDALVSLCSAFPIGGIMNMYRIADSSYVIAHAKLAGKIRTEPENEWWPHVLGLVQQSVGRYSDAIESFKLAVEKGRDTSGEAALIGSCYMELGAPRYAFDYYNLSLRMDSTSHRNYYERASARAALGDVAGALADFDYVVAMDTTSAYAYSQRAWFLQYQPDCQLRAVADYQKAISLSPRSSHSHLTLGSLYRRLGGDYAMLAKPEYEKVIELQDDPESRMFAHLFLGERDKAYALLDSIMSVSDKDKSGDLYNAACFYSLAGEDGKAIESMKKALASGYRDFRHAREDFDLESVRSLPEFEALLSEYEAQSRLLDKPDDVFVSDTSAISIAIPFVWDNAGCRMKCSVNGLPLNVIYNQSQSDARISLVEAAFMLKNGYLSEKDVPGCSPMQIAKTEIPEGTVVVLREVVFDGLTLSNVHVVVSHSQKSPLCFGPSVFHRVGNLELDIVGKTLKISK